MPNPEFQREWQKIRNDVFGTPRMSRAKKILAYKLFLRPMLLYNWSGRRARELKALELAALRDIFGNKPERALYEMFTDCCILSYVRVQKIMWNRGAESDPNNARAVLQAFSTVPIDPSIYFTMPYSSRPRRPPQRQPRRRRPTKPADVCSEPDSQAIPSTSQFSCTNSWKSYNEAEQTSSAPSTHSIAHTESQGTSKCCLCSPLQSPSDSESSDSNDEAPT